MNLTEARTRGLRVTALFQRYGEAVVLTRGGATHSVRCVCAPMDGNTISTYFDGNESVGLVRPALTLYADGQQTDPLLPDDIFTRDGRDWTVRKTHGFRLGDTRLLLVALCD